MLGHELPRVCRAISAFHVARRRAAVGGNGDEALRRAGRALRFGGLPDPARGVARCRIALMSEGESRWSSCKLGVGEVAGCIRGRPAGGRREEGGVCGTLLKIPRSAAGSGP